MKQPSLKNILSNKSGGSTELSVDILKFFKLNINRPQIMKDAIGIFKDRMENFEIVIKQVRQIEKLLQKKDIYSLQKYLDESLVRNQDSFNEIYQNCKSYLRNKNVIYTLSNSRTVFEVLRLVYSKNKKLQIIIAESRTALEGRILAKKFLKAGIAVKLIADCDSSSHILYSDAVLIGADKILSNLAVVNKVGSLNAAIIAKYFQKPFYVLSSEGKISNEKNFTDKQQAQKELWSFRHEKLKIKNHYFEIVPRELITKIITEKNVY